MILNYNTFFSFIIYNFFKIIIFCDVSSALIEIFIILQCFDVKKKEVTIKKKKEKIYYRISRNLVKLMYLKKFQFIEIFILFIFFYRYKSIILF